MNETKKSTFNDLEQESLRVGLLMPKVVNKFRILFTDNYKEYLIITQQVETAERPKLLRDNVTGKLVPDGKLIVVLRDDVANKTSAACMALSETIFNLKIEYMQNTYNHEPDIIDRWTCKDCVVGKLDFNTLDYKSSSALLIKMEIHYKSADHFLKSY